MKIKPYPNKSQKWKLAKEYMEKMPFVSWDRFVHDKNGISVYGWIGRPNDLYLDFCLIEIIATRDGHEITYQTSSKRYDKKISDAVGGRSKTMKCIRVEKYYDLPNIVKLKKIT